METKILRILVKDPAGFDGNGAMIVIAEVSEWRGEGIYGKRCKGVWLKGPEAS